MGHADVLPMLMPALLTGEEEFKEHAMAVIAQLAIPEENKIKLVHEGSCPAAFALRSIPPPQQRASPPQHLHSWLLLAGCLTAIIEDCISSNIPLRLQALKALAHLLEQPLISVMAAPRHAAQ